MSSAKAINKNAAPPPEGGPPAQLEFAALMALQHRARAPQSPDLTLNHRPGLLPSPRQGQGHLIRDIRPFQDGDDPRHLDPNATARIGNPQMRSYHEDCETSLMLLADFRAPMFWGTGAQLRSVRAAFALMEQAWRAALNGASVGLVTLSEIGCHVSPPRARDAGMAKIASHFVRDHTKLLAMRRHDKTLSARPLDELLDKASRHCPLGGDVVLASCFDHAGEALDAALDALARRGTLTVFFLEEHIETTPPARLLPCHTQNTDQSHFYDLRPLAKATQARAALLEQHRLTLRRLAEPHDLAPTKTPR